LNEILDFAKLAIQEKTYHFIAVQNANKMFLSEQSPDLKKAIEKASIILPENAINIGMRWFGMPLKQRNLGGIHIMIELLELSNKGTHSIYLLGAEKSNLDKLVANIRVKYPNIIIRGYRDGFFTKHDEFSIVSEISSLNPNFLFVGLGSPKQELFIHKYFDKLNTNICLGVGGSFNVIAGLEKPAPSWTKYGFEWFYRSLQDPKKFKRYFIINSFFIFRIIKYLIVKK